MGAKVIQRPKYLFTFQNIKHKKSPVGTGIVQLYKTEKDAVTGLFRVVKAGTTNRQLEMDEDAKGINLKSMLEQCEAGKLKKAPLIYGDTTKIPENKFDARRNAFAVANLWKSSPLLRSMYGTIEDYKKDIVAGVDIEKKMTEYKDKVIATTEKALARYRIEKGEDKPIKEQPGTKEQPSTDEVKE